MSHTKETGMEMKKAVAEANKEVSMRIFVILTALLPALLLGEAAQAAPPVWTTRMPLAHIRPSQFLMMMAEIRPEGAASVSAAGEALLTEALPPGVESIVPNDPEKRLFVRGTASGISRVRALLRLLDVPARTVRVSVRVVRAHARPAQNGADRVEVLSTIQTSAAHNTAFPVTLRTPDAEYVAVLKPRIHGDDSVTIDVDLKARDRGSLRIRTTQGARRVRPGKWERLVGVPPAIRQNAGEGTGRYATVYLETSATPVPLLRPQISKGTR